MENDDPMGQWKGGKMHGEGIQLFADGKVKQGRWSEGKFDGENAFVYLIAADLK